MSKEVATRVREVMKEQGIKTVDMAVELDVGTSRMSQIRHGADMSEKQLLNFCLRSGASPTWILLGAGPKYLSEILDREEDQKQ